MVLSSYDLRQMVATPDNARELMRKDMLNDLSLFNYYI